MKPTPLPGITQRPTWPTTPAAPRPSSPAPALTLRLQVLDTPDANREAQRINGQLDLFDDAEADDDHCHACAMHGIDRPAAHTIGDLRLCRPCVDRAPTFAGYAAWTPAMRATRDHLMQESTP